MWKPVLRIGGIVTMLVGLTCLPVGFSGNPKRGLNVFTTIADTGAFVKMGFVLIAGGLIAVLLSRFVPGDME